MRLRERRLIFLTVNVICLIASCQQSNVLNEKAAYIADLECRAIALRERRFALANKIRFTQDTLLHIKVTLDSIRLNDSLRRFDIEKNNTLQASLRLADTIHLSLDSLRKYTFKNEDDKKLFEQKLEEILKKRGCVNS